MARLGFALCKAGTRHTMYGAHYERQCGKFKAAEAEVVQAREEWLRKVNGTQSSQG